MSVSCARAYLVPNSTQLSTPTLRLYVRLRLFTYHIIKYYQTPGPNQEEAYFGQALQVSLLHRRGRRRVQDGPEEGHRLPRLPPVRRQLPDARPPSARAHRRVLGVAR